MQRRENPQWGIQTGDAGVYKKGIQRGAYGEEMQGGQQRLDTKEGCADSREGSVTLINCSEC